MKKIGCFLFFYLFTFNLSFGQNTNIKTIGKKRALYDANTEAIQVSTKQAIESEYFGYDHKIKEISLSNTIPAGFPTKETYSTREEYRTAINKWIKDNPSFIKPEFRSTTISN